jgi:ActR/RegA family two-component response regulator
MRFLIIEDDEETAHSIASDLEAREHEAAVAKDGREGFELALVDRADAARAWPGSGLGHSLVAAIAELHGLDCSASDNHPGLRVTLTTAQEDA